MKAELLPAGRPATLEPLTCARDLGDCRLLNRPLFGLQAERLERAGFAVVNGQSDGVFIRGDAWLADEDIAAMAGRTGPWTLRDPDGNRLAWSGPRAYPNAGLPPVAAHADSFHIRYPWDLLRVHEQAMAALKDPLIEGEVHPGAWITGLLRLGPGSRILPGVCIEGPVLIGAGCKIGPNCYLRGPVSIGDHCHIGLAVELKNAVLLNHTNVGHLSYCGDSILGERVNFGAGTMCANLRHDNRTHRSAVGGLLVETGRRKLGVICGDGVHTGVNTSIYPGRKLWPDRSTRPGDVVQHDLGPG
jgi:bifunctional UDP-N-acetylglucosamine pyrophosphorylase/glucosamine-1-phosphate N-acetyltransferase